VTGWLDALSRLRETQSPAVLVTIVSTKGSVPRIAGTRMVVAADSVAGTIGGGHLEFSAIGIARAMLADPHPEERDLRRFPLGASLGQCCGGLVNLLFEPVAPDAPWVDALMAYRRAGAAGIVATPVARGQPAHLVVTADRVSGSLGDAEAERAVVLAARELLAHGGVAQSISLPGRADSETAAIFLDPVRDPDFDIVLFGAGHVARALVALLANVPCRVTWIDERAAEFPATIPGNVKAVVTDEPAEEVGAAPHGAHFLVMTHSHPLDQALAEAILRRDDFASFGLIGSLSKRRQFERRLAERGIPAEALATMTCPIGVPGIRSKEPAVIAVAVAAQLLQARELRAAVDANRAFDYVGRR
jgi:xanthine dehydrogenase accessory factor